MAFGLGRLARCRSVDRSKGASAPDHCAKSNLQELAMQFDIMMSGVKTSTGEQPLLQVQAAQLIREGTGNDHVSTAEEWWR